MIRKSNVWFFGLPHIQHSTSIHSQWDGFSFYQTVLSHFASFVKQWIHVRLCDCATMFGKPRTILANIKGNRTVRLTCRKIEYSKHCIHMQERQKESNTDTRTHIIQLETWNHTAWIDRTIHSKCAHHTKSQVYLAFSIYDMNIVYIISCASLPVCTQP